MSWPEVPLGEIFEVARGGSPRPIDDYTTEEPTGLNWVMIGDATSGGKYITRTKKKIRPEGLKKTRQVKPGDFILSNSMSFGKPYIMGIDGCIHDGWLLLRPRSDQIDPDYFYHLLGSEPVYAKFSGRAAGATVKNLNSEIVREVTIPLPPLEDQKRIAGILDQADALRRLRARALDKLNTLGQAIFHEMFGDPVKNPMHWNTARLGDLCDVGSSKRVFISEFVEEGVPFYRGTEVGKLGAGQEVEPDLFIAPDHYQSLIHQSGKPEIGDLLLPSICHDGRIWKVDSKEPFYFKDGRVLWIKSHAAKINSDYLRNQLRNIFLNNYTSVASGTTFAELKIVNLKNLTVLCPPIDLQANFSKRIAEVEARQSELHVSSIDLGRLFSSLQHRAFRGEL